MNNTFNTVQEFNKAYDSVRNDILKRHGITDSKKARLINAIQLYQKFNNNWLKATTVKTDMIDRIKRYDGKNAEFMLKALV